MTKPAPAGDPAFLQRQRKVLVKMRKELLALNTTKTATERVAKSDEVRDIEDDARQMAQSEIEGALGAVETQRLNGIDRALAKIEEGTYGFSDLSSDPIPKARLEAMPDALLTIDEEEAREKALRQ